MHTTAVQNPRVPGNACAVEIGSDGGQDAGLTPCGLSRLSLSSHQSKPPKGVCIQTRLLVTQSKEKTSLRASAASLPTSASGLGPLSALRLLRANRSHAASLVGRGTTAYLVSDEASKGGGVAWKGLLLPVQAIPTTT